MNVHCFGISHRTAPIEIREQLWFSAEEIRAALRAMKSETPGQFVLTSTCNRTELYCVTPDTDISASRLWASLVQRKGAQANVRQEHFYSLDAHDAVRHLFEVASGIDSMIVGDVQILNQIKEAFTFAQEEQTTGTFLNRLFTSAFHAGKRARTETEISEGAVSISYAAAALSTLAKTSGTGYSPST